MVKIAQDTDYFLLGGRRSRGCWHVVRVATMLAHVLLLTGTATRLPPVPATQWTALERMTSTVGAFDYTRMWTDADGLRDRNDEAEGDPKTIITHYKEYREYSVDKNGNCLEWCEVSP